MLIRYGYDITVTCTQPTPMVCLLEIRDDRDADIRSPEQVVTNPPVQTTTYSDLFGNTCRRFVAPAGDFSIWGDGTVADSGLVDPVDWNAGETPIAELPDDCLVYLMGSRYCETDRLSQIAWDMFGKLDAGLGPGAGDLRFRQPAHHLRLPECPLDAHRLRGLRGAHRRLPRLCASCHRAVPLHEHPGPLCQRLSRRHRRADPRPHGFQRLDRGLSSAAAG